MSRSEPVVSVETVRGACVVRLAGELDLYNAPAMRDALVDACKQNPQRVVVDLSKVEFLDSTALGVLIEARSRLQNKDSFFLASPQLEARRALEIAGLDRHFAIRSTVQEALAASG